jgi:putative membrane protein
VLVKIALTAALALLADSIQAHGPVEEVGGTLPPVILSGLLLAVFWLMYYIGSKRVPPATVRWLVFFGASLISVLMLIVPLDGWIEGGSAIHMIQHMLIMVVIAPLYVLAQPFPQWVAANGRAAVLLFRPLLRLGRYPMRAGFMQAVVIWFWHSPKFYNLTLGSPWWHLIEHVCFALGAGVFWWSVLVGRRTASALLALLITLMHTGMLGAVLTFAQAPLYGDSLDLQDQQLAGLIMWVPGGLFYLIAGGWCGMRWLQNHARTINSV